MPKYRQMERSLETKRMTCLSQKVSVVLIPC